MSASVKYSDGTMILSWTEAEKLIRVVHRNNFISVPDMILSTIGDKSKLYGNTRLQKGIFIAINEKLGKKYTVEECNFVPYRFGPYSFKIAELTSALISAGYVSYSGKKNTNNQAFFLTKQGKARFKTISRQKPEFVKIMSKLKMEIDEFNIPGLLRYIYNNENYEKYLDRSAVKEKYKDINWGKGRG